LTAFRAKAPIASTRCNQSTAGSGTTSSGTGKEAFGALEFVARTNNSSATLFQVASRGNHFKNAKLTARKAGKEQQEYFTIELTEVYVSEYSNGSLAVSMSDPSSAPHQHLSHNG